MAPLAKENGPASDTVKALDAIEKTVYEVVKAYGFKKHGRTLHRFVSGDISQLINFQLGQAYRGETHLLIVNVGIRVPECVTRSFHAQGEIKKYYKEYECNIRSCLGEIEGKALSCYDLRNSADAIAEDILRQIQNIVVPAFKVLKTRDDILAKRRNYPYLDLFNNHLILLEEAMIYGRRGERAIATEKFISYYNSVKEKQDKTGNTMTGHLSYLEGLALKLGIELN